MSQELSRNYPDWKAPSEDGKPVIWPDPPELLRQTRENQKRLSSAYNVRMQNVPLPQVRRRMRQFIGHDIAQPLLATGHQSELYHAGVWVKNVLVDLAARKLGGQAFHVAVDTDAPKHLHLRWPGGEPVPITDDPSITSAGWSELLGPPSPAQIETIRRKFDDDSNHWSFEPMLPQLLDSLRRLSLESLTLPAAITNATHELDWSLGLRHHAILSSPVWSCEPFLVFAHDLIAHADVVASHYNAALDAYRKAHGMSSLTRPMPDLFVGEEAIEVPFWLDDLHTRRRTRPSVFRRDGGFVLDLIDGQEFVFERGADGWEAATKLQRWLVQSRQRVSPRALTLTMFLRLAMVDQFTHGIGGARYDQVTDRLISGHYGIEPPHFSVTTATLYFPDALSRERVCVPCVQQEGHRLRHGLLGERKRELVAAIDALPRRSTARAKKFFEMHNQLRIAAADSDVMQRWGERLRQTQEREKQEQTLFDRELFYAIQPRQRLAGMIERYNAMLAP